MRAEALPKMSSETCGRLLYWLFFLAGLAWAMILCLRSPGVPVQDEIGHYLLSRDAWQYPEHLLNLWGRPFRTLLFMIPAVGDLGVARLASLLFSCVVVLCATKLAENVGVKMLFLIPAFLWFQPWFHALSYAVLPQVPFSLLLILAIYFWSKNQFTYASIAFGLLPLTRHEGIALTGIWVIYLLLRRNWSAILVAITPLLAFNLVFYLVLGRPAFELYLSAKPTTLYGSGDWWHFFRPLPRDVGIPLLLLTAFALIPLVRLGRKAVLFAPFLIYFFLHTLIYRFGLFASGGYNIFLLPLASMFAIWAAMGLEYIISLLSSTLQGGFSDRRISYRKTKGAAASSQGASKLKKAVIALVLLVAVGSVVLHGLETKPRPMGFEGAVLEQAHEWIEVSGITYPMIVSTHVWFYYFHDLVVQPGAEWWVPPGLETLPVNSLVVWDRHYSDLWGVSHTALSHPDGGWEELASFGDDFAILYRKGW